MDYARCIAAAAPVRKEPSHRAEMVNQLLFGEPVAVLDKKEEWLLARSLFDEYEGWTTNHLLQPVISKPGFTKGFITTSLLGQLKTCSQSFYIPMGSFLLDFEEKHGRLNNKEYTYEGGYVKCQETIIDQNILSERAESWLHAPYLWGGKTAMGVDCSGFVQTVFKTFGIVLQRDAYQQAAQGHAVGFEDRSAGDLAFFENEAGRITHVGIVFRESKIIHASGTVRVDELDEKGIIHDDKGSRTHNLHSIRRITADTLSKKYPELV